MLLLITPHAFPDITTDWHVLIVDDIDQILFSDLGLGYLLF